MNREKRSRSSTGESNSSFVKNVTSRVSGLLPAGITKWFSSPSSSSANGSAANADGTDSSTEDEAPESPSMVQPAAKRLRYSSPVGKYSNLTTSETTLTSNVITETGSVLYNSIQSPPGRNTFRRETNFISTPTRAHSEEVNMNTMMDRSEIENPYRQHTVSAIGQSIALKRKSLFDSEKQKEQSLIACAKTAAHQVKDASQPQFKPHLFGSPFYPGRTMYGGASASSSYINQPSIKQRKMTYVNESKNSDTVNISTSSRCVMDLLENYSSPLIEAKRIPRYELSELGNINQMQPSISTRNSYRTQELYIPSTASIIRMKAKTRLMNSTKAARQIIASYSSTVTPYQPYAANMSKRDHADDDLGPAKSQSKLISRLTRTSRGEDQFAMPKAIELPTATLQIDKNNLPKFSLGGSIPKSTQTSIANTQSNEAFKFSSPLPITADANKIFSPARGFNFGSPDKAAVNTSPPTFSFGTQTSVEATKKLEKKEEPAKTKKVEPEKKTVITVAKASNDWKCSDCLVPNKADAPKCVCCGFKQPSKPTAPAAGEMTLKCTICKLANSKANSDKCVNCEKMRSTLIAANNSLPVTTKVGSSKWVCRECWVNNEETADKCICCGSRNLKGSSPPTLVPFKKAAAHVSVAKDWRCEDCFITNKPSVEKCAACGGAKPGTKPAQNTLPSIASGNLYKVTDSKLAEIVKSQKSYWECHVCLASNANDKTACVCCDADKNVQDNAAPKLKNFKLHTEPNSGFKFGIDPKVQEIKISQKSCWECHVCLASNANDKTACVCCDAERNVQDNDVDRDVQDNAAPKIKNFKLNTEPNSGFKFGIDPKVQETKLDKKVEETPKPMNSEESETNNNIVPKVPSYTFTLPRKESSVKLDGTKSDEDSKPSFSFGIPKQNATPIATGFIPAKVPSPSKLPVIVKPVEVIEKPQEVPTISFQALEATNSSTGLFPAPIPTSNPQNAMNAFLNISLETEKPVSPNKKPPSVALESKPQFSLTTVKASTGGLFAPPATAATSNSLSTQAAPATTPVMGMFPKADTSVSPSISFFPKPETKATPSTLFQNNVQNNPAPMFSFGNNQIANPAPATDTKKFNFSFGSGSTTPAFGAAPQSNSTFSVPIGNGPSIPLGGNGIANPLGGSGGNGLTMSGNVLGSGSTTMFNAPAKENTSMWPNTAEPTNQANQFMASTPAKPAFTFGATPAPSPFGAQPSNAQAHVFGASPQPAQSMFGVSQSNVSQPQSMFPNAANASQPTPMFGTSQPSNPAHSMVMFGAPTATPFGSPNTSMSTFNAPSLAPAQAPAFNFGAPQSSPGIFGFGQQAQPAPQSQMQQSGMHQMEQAGMYNFGGAAGVAAGQVQFNMGSAPSATPGRRVRKAVRRNPQR